MSFHAFYYPKKYIRFVTFFNSIIARKKGFGVAELVAQPPTDPKVRGSNQRDPECS